jgi:hypothetical protein
MIKLSVPDSRKSYLHFSSDLQELCDIEEVHFDFEDVSFATPGWMIAIGSALRGFRQSRPEVACRAVNYSHLTYPANAGFFRFFGMKHGNEQNTISTSERFIPITSLLVQDIEEEAHDQMEHHGDTIQRSSEKLIEVLLQTRESPAFEALTYSLREIMRNVVEHSSSPDLTYAAQYWPRTGGAEIAITDRGIGLASSLSSNPKFGQIDDKAALELAVQPGVSSKTWRKQRHRSVWSNSGYGLYMVRGLCIASGGKFSIASGAQAQTWSSEQTKTAFSSVNGTTVILRLNSDNLKGIDQELEKLRSEARGSQPTSASMLLNPKND